MVGTTGLFLVLILLSECIHPVRNLHGIDKWQVHYLANHLSHSECRTLIASLLYDTYTLPNKLDEAVLNVPTGFNCYQLLLKWNDGKGNRRYGGREQTYEIIARRLKQLNKNDLGNWLTNSAYQVQNEHMQINQNKLDSYATERIKVTQPHQTLPFPDSLHITTTESPIHVARLKHPHIETLEEKLGDPKEWLSYDTLAYFVIVFLFLILVLLVVQLTLECTGTIKLLRRLWPKSNEPPRKPLKKAVLYCAEVNLTGILKSPYRTHTHLLTEDYVLPVYEPPERRDSNCQSIPAMPAMLPAPIYRNAKHHRPERVYRCKIPKLQKYDPYRNFDIRIRDMPKVARSLYCRRCTICKPNKRAYSSEILLRTNGPKKPNFNRHPRRCRYHRHGPKT